MGRQQGPPATAGTGAMDDEVHVPPGVVVTREEDEEPPEEPPPPSDAAPVRELPPVPPPADLPPAGDETAIAAVAPGEAPEAVERQESRLQRLVERVRRIPEDPPKLPQLPNLPDGPRWPELNIVARVLALPRKYCELVNRFPGPLLLLYLVAVSIAIGVAWRPLVVDTDLDSFREVDGPAWRSQAAYLEALKHTRAVKNQSSLGERKVFQLEIIYEAKQTGDQDSSVFAEAVQRDIRLFEQQLRALPGWVDLCGKVDPRARFRCEPGESMGNYVWPRRLDAFLGAQGFFRLAFDGTARERLPNAATLTYLSEGMALPHDPWNFLPQDFANIDSSSQLLRSLFTFTAPSLEADDFSAQYVNFVANELYPTLLAASDRARENPDPQSWDEALNMRIYFQGDEVDAHEVREALRVDMQLAFGALVLSLLVSWVHLRSLFLACTALLILSLSTLLAYVIIGLQEVSLASFLVVFIVFGLGGNSFFKLHDTWQRMHRLRPKPEPVQHLLWFYKAAFLQLAPVSLTAVIFYLFMISLLRPLREFGLFMGTSMLCRCVLSLVIFVPTLLFHERTLRPLLGRRLPGILNKVLEPSLPRSPWGAVAQLCVRAARHGKPTLGTAAVLLVIALVTSAAVAATRASDPLPEIFGTSHHRTAGRALVAAFAPAKLSDVGAPGNVTMCEPWRTSVDLGEPCGLHWCDAQKAEINTSTGCTCFKATMSGTEDACTQMEVATQIVGVSGGANTSVWGPAVESFIRAQWPDTRSVTGLSGAASSQPSLVLEHWESGETHVEPLARLPTAQVQRAAANASGTANATCSVRVFCHCGSHACSQPTGYKVVGQSLAVPTTARRLSDADFDARRWQYEPEARRLASVFDQPTAGKATDQVAVTFGILPPKDRDRPFIQGTPSWSFDWTFEPDSPWSQRAMLAMCVDTPKELNILAKDCWIMDFRKWLLAKGEVFPVQRFGNFQEELKRFVAARPTSAAAMWLNADGDMCATSFYMQVTPGADQASTLRDRKRWLDYVQSKNNEAATSASQAFASSQAWVDAEAYDEALSSSWLVTVLTLVGIAFFGVAYTADLEIMALVVILAFTACVYLAFFMFCLFQWVFGAWELLIMVIFLTHSVDPIFRIGRDFVIPPPPAKGARASSLAFNTCSEEPHVPTITNGGAADETREPAISGPVDEEQELRRHQNVGNMSSMRCEPGSDWDPSSCNFDEEGDPEAGRGNCNLSANGSAAASEDVASEGSRHVDPAQDGPEAALRRAVHHQSAAVLSSAAKLFLCGIILLPCHLRLFARLGAVAMVVAGLMAPCTLVLLPAAILFSGRTRREPDVKPIGRWLHAKCAWVWT